MRSLGTREVLANLDHKKDDAPAPLQKKRNDTTSMYDECKDSLEEIHDNGEATINRRTVQPHPNSFKYITW